MKKYIFLIELLFPLLLFSQNNNNQVSLIGFHPNESFIIYSNDFYGERSTPITLTISKPKELSLKYPTLFYKSDLLSIPFIVLPGENLVIKKDKNTFKPEVATDVVRNNELKFFGSLVQQLGPVYGIKAIDNIPVPYRYLTLEQKNLYQKNISSFKYLPNSLRERDSMLYAVYLERIKFLKSFCVEHHVSDFFKGYISNYFFYAYLNNSLTGLLSSSINEKIPLLLQSNLKRAVLDSKSDTLLIIDSYRNFINNYNEFLTMEATAGEASYMELLESAGAHYKNESKNYLSYIIVRNALRKNYDSTGSLLSIFFKQCTNEKYLTLIKAENQLRNLANSDNNSGEFLSQELKTKSLLDIVKSTEAKLVLVDFWASWCKPCLEEMRYSKNLQTVFRNESRIKFVYVSLDKSISVWKKTADDLRDIMNAKNTYLLLRGFDSDFAKNYTIFSIPRYMLINSKGEVVSFDAPKPDDQELQKQIYAHLNK